MKLMANFLVLLVLCFLGPLAGAAETTAAKCVGEICIGAHSKGPKWLLREYGPGQVHKDVDDPNLVVHCYYDARQKLWIELEFSVSESRKFDLQLTGIFVTNTPMCPTRFASKRAFPDFGSDYGIKIGSTESEIVSKMGAPKRKDDVKAIESKSPYLNDSPRYSSKAGSYRLAYDDNPSSLLFNFYGLENGRLVSMWFAERE
ncbi:MAG: hypothetical protein KA945_11130 [Zoogloea sp.]|jgi:hypothetical protein|nr:hypothetical protein [Zoogloea sp.]MBP7790728.1 hypothetical protein [Zoogloea sp.]